MGLDTAAVRAEEGLSMAPRRRSGTITKRERETYLRELSEGSTHEQAARIAGRARSTLKSLRQRDETFALAVDEACDRGCEMVEQQLVDIAFGRVEAKNTAQVTACFGLLRARRPEVWRESYREPERGRGAQLDVARLDKEERDLLRALLVKARG